MEGFFNTFIEAITPEVFKYIVITISVLGAIAFMPIIFRKNDELLKTVFKLSTLFLYSDSDQLRSSRAMRRFNQIEAQLESIDRMLMSRDTETQQKTIRQELERQIESYLPELIRQKLEKLSETNFSDDLIIRKNIEDSVMSFLSNEPPHKLLQDKRETARLSDKDKSGKTLEKTIQDQMISAGRLKTVMINLFVLFNIGVLSIYLFAAESLSDRAVAGIIGLYISLAAFIVYIYRTSNFRSSVLLALHEDAKKYFDAEEYIRRLKPGASPSDRDVEVLKLLLLNRAEREKMAEHPYELVLKGVSNSNIQLKGGKMISAAKS